MDSFVHREIEAELVLNCNPSILTIRPTNLRSNRSKRKLFVGESYRSAFLA